MQNLHNAQKTTNKISCIFTKKCEDVKGESYKQLPMKVSVPCKFLYVNSGLFQIFNLNPRDTLLAIEKRNGKSSIKMLFKSGNKLPLVNKDGNFPLLSK